MNAQPRRPGLANTVPLLAAVVSALLIVMFTAGARGPLAIVLPAMLAGSAVAAGVWAVLRARSERARYESRLTAWAAAEAVLAERLRIAHDLHDIVSHGLGLITVRAAATRHLPKSVELAAALTDIEDASRKATTELRRMLTVLRDPTAADSRTPAHSLDDLPAIVDAASLAGLRTQLTVGALGSVSQSVQVAVCKTVREALSNTARHSGPTDVQVRVDRDGPYVTVTVADAGPGINGWRATPGAGHGLACLRERVERLGGTLSAERAGIGFRLTARIPDEAP